MITTWYLFKRKGYIKKEKLWDVLEILTDPVSCHSFSFLLTPGCHHSQSSLFLGKELFPLVLMRHPSRSQRAILTGEGLQVEVASVSKGSK